MGLLVLVCCAYLVQDDGLYLDIVLSLGLRLPLRSWLSPPPSPLAVYDHRRAQWLVEGVECNGAVGDGD